MNYHMNKIDSTLSELLNMLVIAEGTMKSSKGTVLTMERIFFKRNLLLIRKRSLQRSIRMRPSPRNRFQRRLTIKESISIAMSKATGEETVQPT